MMISSICIEVFNRSVKDYHRYDNVDMLINNPYEKGSIEHLFFWKSHIDTVQWHLEDIVRDPSIDPVKGIYLKRKIDASNQERTDVVEYIDDFFLQRFADIVPLASAVINTESPAWAIDRLSILILKIYHMREEAIRVDAIEGHREKCNAKLNILLDQQADLAGSVDALLQDIESGVKKMKVYRQMKMYNDPSLNPILYNLKSK